MAGLSTLITAFFITLVYFWPGPSYLTSQTARADVQNVASTEDVGSFSSIAIGADGFPVISYYDRVNADLKVAHCANANCGAGDNLVASTVTTVDSGSNVGSFSSIAVPSGGFPVISYYNATTGDLKVAKCGNSSCSSVLTPTTVDSNGDVGQYTSIAIGTDDFPVISYYDATNRYLKVAKCGNSSCSSVLTPTTVDSNGYVGQYTSIAIGTDGFPVISYYDATNQSMKFVHCGSAGCNLGNSNPITIDQNSAGTYSSIIFGSDGRAIVSYYDGANKSLKIAHCGNNNCNADNTITTVDLPNTTTTAVNSQEQIGQYSSIKIGTDGFPMVAYYNANPTTLTSIGASTGISPLVKTVGALKVLHCGNVSCSSTSSTAPDGNKVTFVDPAPLAKTP